MLKYMNKFVLPTAIIIAALIIGGVLIYGSVNKICLGQGDILTAQEAGEKAINFINQNILQGQAVASLTNIIEEEGFYKLTVDINGQEITAYVTRDGKFLFPEAINLDEQPPSSNLPVEGDPVLGNPDAPVTIIEFSEFQCPFCGRYASETFPQIKKDYVDTGKVKIVFKNFPLPSHDKAQKAAEAGECAFEQGKFWEYGEKLFENQQALEIDNLKQYAQDLGLNSGQFNSCLDSGKYQEEVGEDLQEGQNVGVSGTPTFFINGEELVGAQPFSEFQKIIEDKLK